MILYAVKWEGRYLRAAASVEVVDLDKASVYPDREKAKALQNRFGKGKVVKLILTEVADDQ